MRRPRLVVTYLGLAVLTACGGGGGGASSPQVIGKVTSRNGVPANLAGVAVSCPDTGDATVTAADGSFALDVPEVRPFRLRFLDPAASGFVEVGDCGEAADPTEDGANLLPADVVVEEPDLAGGVSVEVALVDGVVVAFRMHQGGGEHGFDQGQGWMFPTGPDGSLVGQVEVREEDGCWHLEIEIDCTFGAEGLYTVESVCADGEPTALGTVELRSGAGHVSLTACPGDPATGLPTPRDLAGCVVQLVDPAGVVRLTGVCPDLESREGWEYPHGGAWDGGEIPPIPDGMEIPWDQLPRFEDLDGDGLPDFEFPFDGPFDQPFDLPFDLPADFPFVLPGR